MMRRIVLGVEDGKVGDGRDAGAADATVAGVALLLPEMCDEYDRPRAEVDSLARDAAVGEAAGPAEGGPDGTHPAPGANRWVVTTREQRRRGTCPTSKATVRSDRAPGDGWPARDPQEGRRKDEIPADAVEAV